MMLVDTSVGVHHLRHDDAELAAARQPRLVLFHPFVVGELACGNLPARAEVLGRLQALPPAPVMADSEALFLNGSSSDIY